MDLPNENATTEDLKNFANSLSDERRIRLAVALQYPELSQAKDDEGDLKTHEQLREELVSEFTIYEEALGEFEIEDYEFEQLTQALYFSI